MPFVAKCIERTLLESEIRSWEEFHKELWGNNYEITMGAITPGGSVGGSPVIFDRVGTEAHYKIAHNSARDR